MNDLQYSRRGFIKNATLGMGACMAVGKGIAYANEPRKEGDNDAFGISNQTKPLAIAMWDYSWILRHHRAGEFENWDRVLDELQDRGYNAIRIDAMPHLIAPNPEGTIIEEYHLRKDDWKPAMWGNNCSVHIRPREALLEFLPKCDSRGIHVGLASWFLNPRRALHNAENGLFAAWEATLTLLQQNGLLDRILYVDVLNEYPLTHGFDWLKRKVYERADATIFKATNPNEPLPNADAFTKKGLFTIAQKEFFNRFITENLSKLKQRWQQLDFFASLDALLPLEDIDLSSFAALDSHVWFQTNPEMNAVGFDKLNAPNDHGFEQLQSDLGKFWIKNETRMVKWMTARIEAVASVASKHSIPCGNTEGWGSIGWYDHPALNWDFIKASGELCVDLAVKNGYKFICTSNFTHPQFPTLWRDVKWHQRITTRIRNG